MIKFLCTLTSSETIALIASIAAAASALFAALAVYLTYRQYTPRFKIKLCNEIVTDNPQNLYSTENELAFAQVELQNRSARTITITDCFLKINENVYVALEQGMNFKIKNNIGLQSENNTTRDFDIEKDAAHFPLTLHPHQYLYTYIIFPNFTPSDISNVLIGKIKFSYDLKSHPKTRKIIIHRYHQSHNKKKKK